jgi:hypothetical protein
METHVIFLITVMDREPALGHQKYVAILAILALFLVVELLDFVLQHPRQGMSCAMRMIMHALKTIIVPMEFAQQEHQLSATLQKLVLHIPATRLPEFATHFSLTTLVMITTSAPLATHVIKEFAVETLPHKLERFLDALVMYHPPLLPVQRCQ